MENVHEAPRVHTGRREGTCSRSSSLDGRWPPTGNCHPVDRGDDADEQEACGTVTASATGNSASCATVPAPVETSSSSTSGTSGIVGKDKAVSRSPISLRNGFIASP